MEDGTDDDGRDFGTPAYLAAVVTLAVAFTRPPCSDLGGVRDPFFCVGGMGFSLWKLLPAFLVVWVVIVLLGRLVR